MTKPFLPTLLLLLTTLISVNAAPQARDEVPEPLKAWVPWSLYGAEEQLCPIAYNDGESHHCNWISGVTLNLKQQGGSWTQTVLNFKQDWTPIPGNARHWPQNVKLDGKPVVVSVRQEMPGVYLSAGQHLLSGEFAWKEMPESLPVPQSAGLINLSLDGKVVANPKTEGSGLLWLRAGDSETGEARLDLHVHRLIDDDIPMQVTTHIELSASGKNREQLLPNVLLPGFTALSLSSPLPARVEADGSLRVQVRAGRWEILLTGRSLDAVKSLALPKPATPLAEEEIWSFSPHGNLRQVTIEGVPSIDPQQSTLPQNWRKLPAYRVLPGEKMQFTETRRGDATPMPDHLALTRNIWMDFDGGGYTIQDNITGTISQSWRLEMLKSQVLGHVSVDGADQYITRLPAEAKGGDNPGVEIRQGNVHITAESRQGDSRTLSATGWTQNFNSLAATLHLPPGWRLLHVSGVDRAPSSWVERWSLFDFFLLLMTTLATGKLFGWRSGAVALGGLLLSWHEPDAPHLAWINLLVLVALFRVLPAGKLVKALRVYWAISLASLALLLLPFAVNEIRQVLYPALERPTLMESAYPVNAQQVLEEAKPAPPPPPAEVAAAAAPAADAEPNQAENDNAPNSPPDQQALVVPSKQKAIQQNAPMNSLKSGARSAARLAKGDEPLQQRKFNYTLDPNTKVQTGPGLPDWRWGEHALVWSGPVEQGQDLHLWLLSPFMNGLFTLLRLTALLFLLLRLSPLPLRRPNWQFGAGAAQAAAVCLLALLLAPQQKALAAEIPDDNVLGQLRERLLAKPDCLPGCAQINRLGVYVSAGGLQLRLEAHANIDTAIPLPGGANQWRPERVVVDGKPASGLQRDDAGNLWLILTRGVHQIAMESSLARRDTLQIALPLKPYRVDAQLDNWTLEGLTAEGLAGESLLLSRINKEAGGDAGGDDNLPPFVRVSRTLSLGLTWQVTTQVSRIGPSLAPLLVEIPLLAGESVTSSEVRVENGRALINLGRNAEVAFDSNLKEAPSIELIASRAANQIQHWRLDLGPQWHATLAGIPVVQQQDSQLRWLPEWRPWPGEQVKISLVKPVGIPGQTLTLDSSRLNLQPGIRATDATLTLSLRAGQGGTHTIQLPEGAALQSVVLGGQPQAIRQDGRRVTLPINPGRQDVTLSWREPRGMDMLFRTSQVDIGIAGVNGRLQLTVPQDRWTLLLGGPRLGPAILFWGVVVVLGVVAFGLGRVRITPLRGWQWFLLGLGLAPVSWGLSMLLIGWLLALGARGHFVTSAPRPGLFNAGQFCLVVWTVAALVGLFVAVQQGLLGYPDMQITGNGSNAWQLNWFTDRTTASLPTAWVLSLPLLAYRLIMLLWATWLAYALLKWIKWGWEAFSSGPGMWCKRPPRKAKVAEAAAVAEGDDVPAQPDQT